MATPRLSEQRARTVTKELLVFRGWDIRPVSSGGQLLEESEYLAYPNLRSIFEKKSKTGPGIGKPDFLLVDSPKSLKPLIVIDTKPCTLDIAASIRDTEHYGDAIHQVGQNVLSVAVAGADREVCAVKVRRKISGIWKELTLHNEAIDWIPSPAQSTTILSIRGRTEVSAECPSPEILADQAMRLNEIFRECKIKDEYRPIYAATFMLGLWFKDVMTDHEVVLSQINDNASKALKAAQKSDLSQSLRVDTENEDLAQRAWQIIDILTKLNIRSFIHEHDYLGQLYETFFRYTGGNTIGQYFTPRHIIDMMCEITAITPNDIVFDPACGTGGFLIGALRRMIRLKKMDYEQAVKQVHQKIYGMESEPATAALCIANMILRGDGKSGIIRADCFARTDYPAVSADVSLLNPPFPHKKTDTPSTKFIDRALDGIRNKGLVASLVPYSLLVRVGEWHNHILKSNKLLFVATMPSDLFNPYASFNTAIIVLQKGVPHSGVKVFFARLSNDGFKIKKNNRVHRDGSQIELIQTAYQDKKQIPKVSAFKPITPESKEWSPEAFIEDIARSDEEFISGFERHMRLHAAFYVTYGHRLLSRNPTTGIETTPRIFNGDSTLSLSNKRLGSFLLSDYFDVMLGGKDEIEDLKEGGNTPIVSTSEFNNGVTTWKTAKRLYGPNVISVATDGSTCSSFVQEYSFYAFYKVAILTPKIDMDVDAMYYIAYLLKLERWRYVYARKFGKGRLVTTKLYGPVTKKGVPDFAMMARLTRKTASYPIILSFRGAKTD